MKDNRIQIRGNKEGINAIIDIDKFSSFNEVINTLIDVLSAGKGFYNNSIVKLTSNFKNVSEEEIIRLKNELFEKINIKDCIFDDISNKTKIEREDNKTFSGVDEGRTKFIRHTIRGGQSVDYNGNIVIIGDINSGAEVSASGNIIVLGSIKGRVRAGAGGDEKSIIAAFSMQPELIQICDVITISPDDGVKPEYPEAAKIKDGSIILEPYLVNKYI